MSKLPERETLAGRPALYGPLPGKTEVCDDAGVPYLEYRRSLLPRYRSLHAQIALTLVLLLAGVLVPALPVWRPDLLERFVVSAIVALDTGVCLYLLSLYAHASAHGDLAADVKRNDRLANVFIFPFSGLPIEHYRRVHFAHHRLLGRAGDPENGYLEPLDWRFTVRSLTGKRFVDAVRRHVPSAEMPEGTDAGRLAGVSCVMVAGILIQLAVVGGTVAVGEWQVAVGWLVGLSIVAPSLTALRLVLEHRPPAGHISVDGSTAVTRTFSGRAVAPWFGAAGFRTHLVHHWDPQVHCTRLRDVERYLVRTGAAETVTAATMRYQGAYGEIRGPSNVFE